MHSPILTLAFRILVVHIILTICVINFIQYTHSYPFYIFTYIYSSILSQYQNLNTMGNQNAKNSPVEHHEDEVPNLKNVFVVQSNTEQKLWENSQKTINDLHRLINSQPNWHIIIRPFLKKINSKQQYQSYLCAILQAIIQSFPSEFNSKSIQQPKSIHKDLSVSTNEIDSQRKSQKELGLEAKTVQQGKKREQMRQLFQFFKQKLQQSYFAISYEKAGVRQSMGSGEFQQSLKSICKIQPIEAHIKTLHEPQETKTAKSSQQATSFQRLIPSLMLTELYQFSSVNQNYMNEMFIEINIKAYDSLEHFTTILIEEFITVDDDDSNLSKFVTPYKVFQQSLSYLQTCSKILTQHEQQQIFQKIKTLKYNPTAPYIRMCRVFLNHRNPICAEVIIRSLIQKGYQLKQSQIYFYFYVLAYGVFLYHVNFSIDKLNASQMKEIEKQSQGSFLAFTNEFQNFSFLQIFHYFLLFRQYSEIDLLRDCFEKAFDLKEPLIGGSIFLKHLKQYAFSQKSTLRMVILILKNHLNSLQREQKKDIEGLFLRKLCCEWSKDIIQFQKHVIDLGRMYKFSKEGYEFVKIVFKVSSILNKFRIDRRVSELAEFLFHNKSLRCALDLKQAILGYEKGQKSMEQLQFLGLVTIKRVISQYLVLGESKQQVVFIVQDKFKEQYFQYSTRQIESLFILTEYLHKSIFQPFIPLQQLHQLLFQHMLYFRRYDQIEMMTRPQNLSRYYIQLQVVKLLIIDHIRQTLLTSQQQSISLLTQNIKRQLNIVQKILSHNNHTKQQYSNSNSQFNQQKLFTTIDYDQYQSIKALFKLLLKLDFYSISLNQQQKLNININLLYFLIQHYQQQIEVFQYDELYRLILLASNKNNQSIKSIRKNNDNSYIPITNQYLKFKIDLAHLSFQKGKLKFGQTILKQVLQYQPPWIASQIIKIIRAVPNSTPINQYFFNLAFQYCVKGEDLMYLLKVWKQKVQEKQKKTGQKITQIFQSTKKFMVVDDSYIKDQKQYRNLIGQMSFNDETLKSPNYDLFFTLLGTQPERAFYLIYSKNLDIVKIQIILKQGMKMGIINILNTSKMLFKLLFLVFIKENKIQPSQTKVSFIKFKNMSVEDIMKKLSENQMFSDVDKNSLHQKQISFIMLKKIYKALKSLLILPTQFIHNYLENSSFINQDLDEAQLLYMFSFDENYREKILIGLKDEPMGRNDIKIYKQLCHINGMNILDLTIFNLTNYLNTVQSRFSEEALEDEKIQNMLQKIVTWTQNDPQLIHSIVSKFIQKIFASQMLYNILKFIRERQNPLIRQIVSEQHMQILQSLKRIEVNTELHGLITQQFIEKPIGFNPKHKLSEKHTKILKRQLRLRNVFLISKILYFSYGMSTDIQKQVLKIFVKENQSEQEMQIYNQIKKKIKESQM